ncbi:HNH endonuclease family protein [Amycolatopsis sp. H20-H5]|uniref:HNH endonuclease family protein n=1 Tax=Amycolatopsis sp. H20-H5 TaxID=3046309 RepID=UPI002DB6AC24|nr:HNH endonuclease family protein [Amycolatopsis sp. H20-H5]MEC3974599.1 HNH endonuclease family protein [Amycolatopsis sp. H20-H5]
MTTRILIAAALAALALTTAACNVPSSTASPAAGGSTTDVQAAVRALHGLAVKPEDTGAHYNRDDWPHWSIRSGQCDAREDTLKRQGKGVTTRARCTVTGGTWVSRYDGVTVTDPKAIDIDHMVPLAEVARSGSREWTRAQREHYANDPAVLVAVTAKSNRSKGDQDPAKWLPGKDRCGYVAQWVAVKSTYHLTIGPAERDAMAAVLGHCGTEAR